MRYSTLAKMKLHSIELRHMFTKETEFTRMLDRNDWAEYLHYYQLAEQEEKNVKITVDEPSYRNAEKK